LRAHHLVEPRQRLSEDVLVEKQQRRERLVLRRRRHVALRGEPAQESRHLSRAHLARMPLLVEENEAADPVPVRLLGAPAVMPRAYHLAKALDQPLSPAVRSRSAFR
jgi:hypothetical protein